MAYFDERDDSREDASVTPTGMPRNYGQQRQASRRRPNPRVQGAILGGQAGPPPGLRSDGGPRNTTQPVGPGSRAIPPQGPVGVESGPLDGNNPGQNRPPTPPPARTWRDAVGLGQYQGAHTGYEDKFFSPEESGAKYTALRILTQFPGTPSGLAQGVNDPLFKELFPNAFLIEEGGRDKINFGDTPSDFVKGGPPVGIIDVLRSSDPTADTSDGWWWGHTDKGPMMQQPMGVVPGQMPGNDMYNQVQGLLTGGGVPEDNQLLQLLELLMNQSGVEMPTF